jgi:hypothetical protein
MFREIPEKRLAKTIKMVTILEYIMSVVKQSKGDRHG